MIVKIIGGLLISAASYMAGLYFASVGSFKINDLLEWKKALQMLRSEISFAGTPLPEAFINISHRMGKPISDFFLDASKKLTLKEKSFHEIWTANVSAYNSKGYLQSEEWDIILSLGKTLGYLDRSMQNDAIGLAISRIDERLGILTEQAAKYRKMYTSLGVTAGLLLTVLLI